MAAFGCHSFALLFDDIDPELSEADQSVFSSSACAQVSITNEVYEHLGQPKFLFCPTGQFMNLQWIRQCLEITPRYSNVYEEGFYMH